MVPSFGEHVPRSGYASDSFSTIHHDLHRIRRKAISPFFLVSKIAEFQPVIRAKVDKLCQTLTSYKDGQVVRLSRAWMALTTDIISEYAFAKTYDQLDSPDFEDTMHEALIAIYTTGHFALHFPIAFPVLDKLPEWLVRADNGRGSHSELTVPMPSAGRLWTVWALAHVPILNAVLEDLDEKKSALSNQESWSVSKNELFHVAQANVLFQKSPRPPSLLPVII
jgi:hypothetical protein